MARKTALFPFTGDFFLRFSSSLQLSRSHRRRYLRKKNVKMRKASPEFPEGLKNDHSFVPKRRFARTLPALVFDHARSRDSRKALSAQYEDLSCFRIYAKENMDIRTRLCVVTNETY